MSTPPIVTRSEVKHPALRIFYHKAGVLAIEALIRPMRVCFRAPFDLYKGIGEGDASTIEGISPSLQTTCALTSRVHEPVEWQEIATGVSETGEWV